MYAKQKVVERVQEDETEEMSNGRGVRQICYLSSTLFNIYTDKLTQKAKKKKTRGILVGEERTKPVKYVDDTWTQKNNYN